MPSRGRRQENRRVWLFRWGEAGMPQWRTRLVASHLAAGTGAGLPLFVAAMMLADRFPVPLDGLDAAGISLSFVFGVAAVVIFGWAGGLVAVVIAAGVGGLLIAPLRGGDVGQLVLQVALCGIGQHAVNTLLVAGAVATSSNR